MGILMLVQLPQSDGELFGEELEELRLLAGAALELGSDLHHGTDDVLIAELWEFAFAPRVVERRNLGHDVGAAWLAERGVFQRRECF